MSEQVKPTPTPWYITERSRDGKAIFIRNDHDGWHRLAIEVDSDDCDYDTAEANAEFLCRAVNSHAALVALAERVAEQYEGTDAPLGEMARAALTAAKDS